MLSLQPCPTLCDPMDCSPPGSSVHGILQTRTLEWVAVSTSGERNSRIMQQKRKNLCLFSIFGLMILPLFSSSMPSIKSNGKSQVYRRGFKGPPNSIGLRWKSSTEEPGGLGPKRPLAAGQAVWESDPCPSSSLPWLSVPWGAGLDHPSSHSQPQCLFNAFPLRIAKLLHHSQIRDHLGKSRSLSCAIITQN